MSSTVGVSGLTVHQFLEPHRLAAEISEQYMEWEMFRRKWQAEKQELRNYIFATDTRDTSTNHLPWKNSVHIPKICQIRDNLYSNYMSALFPNDRAVRWEGDDRSAVTKEKRTIIEAYINNKLKNSDFMREVGKCVYDFIDYGNCFGVVDYVQEETTDPETGERILGYVGPKFFRISPYDIVFNPLASSFEKTPKIIRSLKTLASLRREIEDNPDDAEALEKVFDSLMQKRREVASISAGDFAKSEGMIIDGFGSFYEYLDSDYVEILDFYGDLYDSEKDELLKNHRVTILDRSIILRKEPLPNWFGVPPIFHAGWRLRPDNLYAMGPLDNLVGLQYRIDHLENAKSDALDLIIHPVLKIRGQVADFNYGPNARIYVEDEGDVEFMAPDGTALTADTQIALYEQKMEEMAGAPKMAMGFRTPGEKTAFEVQILENSANKVFLNKTQNFEISFIEPIVNSIFETGRRMMSTSELVRTVDPAFNAVRFKTITREDITARGKIRPIGARHFAKNANMIQNLVQFFNSPLGQDTGVRSHISGLKLAKLMEELLDLEQFDLVQENVQVEESMETQRAAQTAESTLDEEQLASLPQEQQEQVLQAREGQLAQQAQQGNGNGGNNNNNGG